VALRARVSGAEGAQGQHAFGLLGVGQLLTLGQRLEGARFECIELAGRDVGQLVHARQLAVGRIDHRPAESTQAHQLQTAKLPLEPARWRRGREILAEAVGHKPGDVIAVADQALIVRVEKIAKAALRNLPEPLEPAGCRPGAREGERQAAQWIRMPRRRRLIFGSAQLNGRLVPFLQIEWKHIGHAGHPKSGSVGELFDDRRVNDFEGATATDPAAIVVVGRIQCRPGRRPQRRRSESRGGSGPRSCVRAERRASVSAVVHSLGVRLRFIRLRFVIESRGNRHERIARAERSEVLDGTQREQHSTAHSHDHSREGHTRDCPSRRLATSRREAHAHQRHAQRCQPGGDRKHTRDKSAEERGGCGGSIASRRTESHRDCQRDQGRKDQGSDCHDGLPWVLAPLPERMREAKRFVYTSSSGVPGLPLRGAPRPHVRYPSFTLRAVRPIFPLDRRIVPAFPVRCAGAKRRPFRLSRRTSRPPCPEIRSRGRSKAASLRRRSRRRR
jgi:hypothetical protein